MMAKEQLQEETTEILSNIKQYSQTQCSLSSQLELLVDVAIRLGLYDAADFIARLKK